MSPRDAADLEWPLSEGTQVSALPPVWIAMIISCWSVKRLKFPSVTLTHMCGTYSHNWWAKGLPGVGVVKIFCDSDSDSLGWKSFRLRLLDSDSIALPQQRKDRNLSRKCTTSLRRHQNHNGNVIERNWLCFSFSQNCVKCFTCRLMYEDTVTARSDQML